LANIAVSEVRISRKTATILSLGIAVLALLDGVIPQLEMAVTGGNVPVSTAVLKLMLIGVLVLAITKKKTLTQISSLTVIWIATTFYLLVDSLYLSYGLHVTFSDIAIGFNSYYAYLLICPLAMFVRSTLGERKVIEFLLIVFLVCFSIGTLQFLLVSPLLYTASADNSFSALSWQAVDGRVRAFSLFTSGLGYGGFCCIVGALSVSLLRRSRFKKLSILLFLSAAFGCYSSLTRNCYIQFIFTSCATFCFTSRRLTRWVKYSPVIFLFLSALLALKGVSADTSASTGSAVTSNISVLLRAAAWLYYTSIYWGAPLAEKSFGLGLIQNANAANGVTIPLDNQYLAVLMNIGLVGFVLTFWLQWKMWIRLYNRSIMRPSVLTVSIAGFWSTFLSVYFYNVSLATFCLIFIIAIVALPSRVAKRRTQHPGLGKA